MAIGFSLLLLLVLMFLSIPVAASLGLASFLPSLMGEPIRPGIVIRTMVTAMDSFPLLAVPLFILAGEIMTRGGLARRLFHLADVLVGRFTGGLAIATVLACMFFGAISGSAPATVAAIGSMAIPLLVARGYEKTFSTALVVCAGTLGVIIPPSIPLIIYGAAADVSVGKLFIGGIVPGIVVGLCLMVHAYLYGRRNRDRIISSGETVSPLAAVRESIWALLTPLVVLGGIYTGMFTPTEAAAVAVAYGLFVSVFIYREIEVRQIPQVLAAAATTIAPILIIAAAGAAFGRILTLLQAADMIGGYVSSIVSNEIALLLIINVILLVVGMFMEKLASIIVLTPILLPIVMPYGVDPVHFGLIMVVNLAIGFITPPVGVNLYIASQISGLGVMKIARHIARPLAFLLIALALITYIPGLTTWLPGLF
ncbi:TRAP transporter large permease [Mariluticola halotolerans]|uniref:TRAP transporter large permease n=1 Tax=Mariluticola halotolerans TaxID=2909283 RepID=UPI0026E477D5|nr:TRAP transporter large permease [Mariluticola halotolerans]UJQ96097.1 TRAP transporter large permease [Mariluticola halotolerans]